MLLLAGSIGLVISVRSCIRTGAEAPGRAVQGVSHEGELALQRAGDLFVHFFNLRPEVRMEGRVITAQQASPIAEFAVLSREYPGHSTWKQSWLGSWKTVEIDGVMLAKAGFDLREPFILRLDEKGRVVAEMPPARILDLEQKGELRFHDENGLWNRLQGEDRQEALASFQRTMREAVEASDLKKQAEEQVRQRLQELADRNRAAVIFYFRKPGSGTP